MKALEVNTATFRPRPRNPTPADEESRHSYAEPQGPTPRDWRVTNPRGLTAWLNATAFDKSHGTAAVVRIAATAAEYFLSIKDSYATYHNAVPQDVSVSKPN
ncbi:hypothetical protein SKAU_G00214880 [Synaphobranchus kaupii]|uniref:Uncharacterized protein n=1 Tax=Synaphobranchus kaupii TaxID=118154 RepID=A0A9Q1F9L8_SYNKA|nr:hypothetical protein SKAU_G00214880 [Synaphobranchus kaupii]